MGRPPCCDKTEVKKGPWTPDEDITLVTYVQEHGPGNWRAVPRNTGLRRCSKSCRLRWTNYLRPGIKRGNFTDQEEKMIIQLQDLLGNKWAAIASYLPERTDNDIKNYWNTHLKKKLKKSQTCSDSSDSCRKWLSSSTTNASHIDKGQWERKLQTDIQTAKQALHDAISFDDKPVIDNRLELTSKDYSSKSTQLPSTYASSTENIARLLKRWMQKAPNVTDDEKSSSSTTQHSLYANALNENSTSSVGTPLTDSKKSIDLRKAFESLYGLESWDSSNSTSPETSLFQDDETKPDPDAHLPLSMLENWLLLDDGTPHAKQSLSNLSFIDENADLF